MDWLFAVIRYFFEKIFGMNETIKPISQPIPTEPIKLTPVKIDMISKWCDAIARWEGADPALRNPGNLKYSTLTASWGAIKDRPASDGGCFARFNSMEEGRQALYNFLKLGVEGQLIISHPKPCTLDAFTTKFAGNPPQGYKNGIAKMLGVPLTTDISTFTNSV